MGGGPVQAWLLAFGSDSDPERVPTPERMVPANPGNEGRKRKAKMNKKSTLILGLLLVGLLGMSFSLQTVYAIEGPVIRDSFAQKDLRPGDTLRIYLKASSLDSSLKAIYVTVEQSGVAVHPLSIIRLKKEDQQKELSGYLYLPTISSNEFFSLKLIVHIQDAEGRFSEPAVFPVEFKPQVSPENPPPGVFAEKELGPIMIRLRNMEKK
jgi:hypothetical protein